MKYRLQTCLALVIFCLLFCVAELGMFRIARIPIAEALNLASPGPLSLNAHTLLDRLNEWRADTPELPGMLRRMITWSLCWTAFKQVGFSWGTLAIIDPGGAQALGVRALGGLLAQMLYLALPRLLLFAGIFVCAQGLMGSNPFALWALVALLSLLAMLQVSADLAMVHVMTPGAKPYSPRHAGSALGAWILYPSTMIRAWLLRVAQMTVAAGPIYQQVQAQPGPSAPHFAAYFVASSFVLWALRMWILRLFKGARAQLQVPPRALEEGLE